MKRPLIASILVLAAAVAQAEARSVNGRWLQVRVRVPPRSHHRAGLQQGAIDRQLGRWCPTATWSATLATRP